MKLKSYLNLKKSQFDLITAEDQMAGIANKHKEVINDILKLDFSKANISLSNFQAQNLNPNHMIRIKHELEVVIDKLIKETKHDAYLLTLMIEKDVEDNQVSKVNDNYSKLTEIKTLTEIWNLLGNETQRNISNSIESINNTLAAAFQKRIDSVYAYRNANCFVQAESQSQNLIKMNVCFAAYTPPDEIIIKLRTLQDGCTNMIIDEEIFSDINNFIYNPPKVILSQLGGVASAKFQLAYTSISQRIKNTIIKEIDEVKTLPLERTFERMRELRYAINSIPKDLQDLFADQLDQLNIVLTQKHNDQRNKLNGAISNENLNDQEIKYLAELVMMYKSTGMNELLSILYTDVTRRMKIFLEVVQSSLLSQEINMRNALNAADSALKFKNDLAKHFSEIEIIYSQICSVFRNCLLSVCKVIENADLFKQVEMIQNLLENLFLFVNHSIDSKLVTEIIIAKARENLIRIHFHLKENNAKFDTALKDLHLNEIINALRVCNEFEVTVNMIKNSWPEKNISDHFFLLKVYNDMVSEFTDKMRDLKKEYNKSIGMIGQKDDSRELKEDFFRGIQYFFNKAQEVNNKMKMMLLPEFDTEEFEKECSSDITKRINWIEIRINKILSMKIFDERNAEEFRYCYNHLKSIKKFNQFPGIDIRPLLKDAKDNIYSKISELKISCQGFFSNHTELSLKIIQMKSYSIYFFMYKKINDYIDGVLADYKSQQGSHGISKLCVALESSAIGLTIISEHKCLKHEDLRRQYRKMIHQDDIEYMLDKLSGDFIDKEDLRIRYELFNNKLNELLKKILNSTSETEKQVKEEIIINAYALIPKLTNDEPLVNNTSFRDRLHDLMAHIFAIWAKINSADYNEALGIDAKDALILKPHVGQVIAIFRIFGIGYSSKLDYNRINNLIEVGTGEGKSVILGVTACIFALAGYEVSCSCYSEYLSTRDKKSFEMVFKDFGVEDKIDYGTFSSLCEGLLNERCNVRETVLKMILKNKPKVPKTNISRNLYQKVLLIDEVDVFLSNKFYGEFYTPAVTLKSPEIINLLDACWQKRKVRPLNLKVVKGLPEYESCRNKYSNWVDLIDEAIKDLIQALLASETSPYLVKNDKIAYIDREIIVENVTRGHETVWIYYKEFERQNISEASLKANVGIFLKCGTFSYAEMPHSFSFISGVTGTLTTLADTQKNILKTVYKIEHNTYLPSVFGKNNLVFHSETDVKIEREEDYFMRILTDIQNLVAAKRAVLVFFENETKLMKFYNSRQLASLSDEVQKMTEETSLVDREIMIKNCSTIGRVTLLTRTYGRGTDFICRNPQLLANGGIHVIQTFFSEELSEEAQIKGRCARQGDNGSFRMIFLDKDLEWVLGSNWQQEIANNPGTIYDKLSEKRTKIQQSKSDGKNMIIMQYKEDHRLSVQFMHDLVTGKILEVKEFLVKKNLGPKEINYSSRTMILMDATGSMEPSLSASKETVLSMFERASHILNKRNIAYDNFSLKFAVYRNYSSGPSMIFESSPWLADPVELRDYMSTIYVSGGQGNEAIEIALWHAANEYDTEESISQIILIGDSPANTQEEVKSKRAVRNWNNTPYAKSTFWSNEIDRFRTKKPIPIHAFYVDHRAENYFREIASLTNGRCEFLDIKSSKGAELLTNFVTEEILRATAGDQGNAVVAEYRKIYIS